MSISRDIVPGTGICVCEDSEVDICLDCLINSEELSVAEIEHMRGGGNVVVRPEGAECRTLTSAILGFL